MRQQPGRRRRDREVEARRHRIAHRRRDRGRDGGDTGGSNGGMQRDAAVRARACDGDAGRGQQRGIRRRHREGQAGEIARRPGVAHRQREFRAFRHALRAGPQPDHGGAGHRRRHVRVGLAQPDFIEAHGHRRAGRAGLKADAIENQIRAGARRVGHGRRDARRRIHEQLDAILRAAHAELQPQHEQRHFPGADRRGRDGGDGGGIGLLHAPVRPARRQADEQFLRADIEEGQPAVTAGGKICFAPDQKRQPQLGAVEAELSAGEQRLEAVGARRAKRAQVVAGGGEAVRGSHEAGKLQAVAPHVSAAAPRGGPAGAAVEAADRAVGGVARAVVADERAETLRAQRAAEDDEQQDGEGGRGREPGVQCWHKFFHNRPRTGRHCLKREIRRRVTRRFASEVCPARPETRIKPT